MDYTAPALHIKTTTSIIFTRLYTLIFASLLFAMIPVVNQAQVWSGLPGIPVNTGFKTIKFIDSNTGWVAGENGIIIKTTDGGVAWNIQPSGTSQTIRSIFFFDANNGWACGDGGLILHSSNGGTTWQIQPTAYSVQFYCTRFVSGTTGWVSGKGNLLLKTTDGGANWTQQLNQGVDMWGMNTLSASNGWAVGGFNSVQNSPTLLKTSNGSTWNFQSNSGVTSFLAFNDIQFTDANNGWLIGGNGTIRHTTDAGATPWVSQASGTQFELLGMDFINSNNGFICGRQGVILATNNGGSTWSAQSSGTTSKTLWEMDMLDATTGFAVGDSGLILKYHVSTPSLPLQLLQPNSGGDIFLVATRRFIIWQAQAGVTNVKLEFSTTGNTGPWTTIIASTPANTGSYSWTIPNTPSINCFVRISNTSNSSVNAISAAPFYIMNTAYGKDYSVLTEATVTNSPPGITISWQPDQNALSYSIDKKLATDAGWTYQATLTGTTNSYLDNNVATGIIYEYRVVKTTPQETGYGYVYTGIDIPVPDARGTVLLVVDSSLLPAIQNSLALYREDLVADGWKVREQAFNSNSTDVDLKTWVNSQYFQPGAGIKALVIVGHFAIPYSGNFAPDGHAERIGAQPADIFYADVDGNWTDQAVTTTTTGNIYTSNVPGDGRWDQNVIPSPAELQVGRIDMKNMPGFALDEAGLVNQYLQKNHAFRYKIINPQRRAMINTHLDNSLFSTSAGAWRSFSPMLGFNNTGSINTNGCSGNNTCGNFIDSLENRNYLWGYMAGGGTDTSCADPVFTSSQCINRVINCVFMQLYGSYFVEWAKGGITGTVNGLFRATLANPGMPLATCWTGGSPRWYFHHMGLGETIGFSTLQSQNNTSLYDPGNNTLLGGVHMVLMGDPTLRLHAVYPVSSLHVSQLSTSLQLSWTPSPDSEILGYNIYRSDAITGDFIKLNTSLITNTGYSDNAPMLNKNNLYMVRAVKNEISATGSYQNMSEGIFVSASVTNTFVFNGNGNWSEPANWMNSLIPPASLPAGYHIVIDPISGGNCFLDQVQNITAGASLLVKSGKNFGLPGVLFLQ